MSEIPLSGNPCVARLALISDVHGNLDALEAVLTDANAVRAEAFVCLGDVVGYGPEPDACLDLVAQSCQTLILGNHDEAMIHPALTAAFNERARVAAEFARERLLPGHLMLIESMRHSAIVGGVSLAHGSFASQRYDYLTHPQSALRALRAMPTAIGCVGHTHMPSAFILGSDADGEQTLECFPMPEGAALVIPAGARVIVNPGSVGQPRDGDHRASWGLLDTEHRTFTVRRVSYDLDAVERKIERLGLPDHLGRRLRIGA